MTAQGIPAAVVRRPRGLTGGLIDALVASGLFVVSLVVYLVNQPSFRVGDTVPNSLVGFNIVEHHALDFDAFRDSYWYGPSSPFAVPYWFTQSRSGHVVSAYPIGAGIVSLPLTAVEALWLRLTHHGPGSALAVTSAGFDPTRVYYEKLNASIITAAAIAVAYLVLRTRFGRPVSGIAALLLAFGTSFWTTASQAMWQHGPLLLILLLATRLILVTSGGRRQVVAWAVAGILFGFVFGIRPTGIAYGAAVALFLPRLGGTRAAAAAYLVGLAGTAGAWVLWAEDVYGSLTAGYEKPAALYSFTLDQAVDGFTGLTVSPARGILIYTPLVALALGVAVLARRRALAAEPVAVALLLGAAVIAVSYCFDLTWFGGWSYGPRMLSDTLPAFVFPLGFLLEWAAGARWRIAAIVVVASWSVFTQFVGAFGQPGSDWNAVPAAMAQRLWDWRDNPIRRQLNGTVHRFTTTATDRPSYLARLRGSVVSIEGSACRPGTTVTLPAAGRPLSAQLLNPGPTPWYGYRDSPRLGEVRMQLTLTSPEREVRQMLYLPRPTSSGGTAEAVGQTPPQLRPGTYTVAAQLIANGLGQVPGSAIRCTAVVVT